MRNENKEWCTPRQQQIASKLTAAPAALLR